VQPALCKLRAAPAPARTQPHREPARASPHSRRPPSLCSAVDVSPAMAARVIQARSSAHARSRHRLTAAL
jgi:hypothetical protein